MEKISFDLDKMEEAQVIEITPKELPTEQPKEVISTAKVEDEKPKLRQSSVQHYFTCAKKYKLNLI
ncbi:MAG TPA: hypothetical protein VMV32_11015, partial [Ignavibacteriaceae bacterium]|nr:hypothetical protein [Ignavibacteriaceae bacterium]